MDTTGTLKITTWVDLGRFKRVTLMTRHCLNQAEAADIAMEVKEANPHLKLTATFTVEQTWEL